MSFVNFSNHSSEFWSEKQKKEAEKWGEIIDFPFPNVSAELNEDDIQAMAEECIEKIIKFKPYAVMCQGEFTLAFAVVRGLNKAGITVVSACSGRKADEIILEDGKVQKSSIFDFVRFRKYQE